MTWEDFLSALVGFQGQKVMVQVTERGQTRGHRPILSAFGTIGSTPQFEHLKEEMIALPLDAASDGNCGILTLVPSLFEDAQREGGSQTLFIRYAGVDVTITGTNQIE